MAAAARKDRSAQLEAESQAAGKCKPILTASEAVGAFVGALVGLEPPTKRNGATIDDLRQRRKAKVEAGADRGTTIIWVEPPMPAPQKAEERNTASAGGPSIEELRQRRKEKQSAQEATAASSAAGIHEKEASAWSQMQQGAQAEAQSRSAAKEASAWSQMQQGAQAEAQSRTAAKEAEQQRLQEEAARVVELAEAAELAKKERLLLERERAWLEQEERERVEEEQRHAALIRRKEEEEWQRRQLEEEHEIERRDDEKEEERQLHEQRRHAERVRIQREIEADAKARAAYEAQAAAAAAYEAQRATASTTAAMEARLQHLVHDEAFDRAYCLEVLSSSVSRQVRWGQRWQSRMKAADVKRTESAAVERNLREEIRLARAAAANRRRSVDAGLVMGSHPSRRGSLASAGGSTGSRRSSMGSMHSSDAERIGEMPRVPVFARCASPPLVRPRGFLDIMGDMRGPRAPRSH